MLKFRSVLLLLGYPFFRDPTEKLFDNEGANDVTQVNYQCLDSRRIFIDDLGEKWPQEQRDNGLVNIPWSIP